MKSASKREVAKRRERLNDMRVAMLCPENEYSLYLSKIELKKDR